MYDILAHSGGSSELIAYNDDEGTMFSGVYSQSSLLDPMLTLNSNSQLAWEIIVVDDGSRKLRATTTYGEDKIILKVSMRRMSSRFVSFLIVFVRQQKAHNFDSDIVTGTRYRSSAAPMPNLEFSRGANFLAATVLNPGVSDLTGSLFRLYKRSVLQYIISVTQSKGYVFQMEMMVRAKALGYTVGEVPITFVDRLYGESKLGADEIVSYGKGVWGLFVGV
ncbi:hypothetical protein C8J55DRAFT_576672 [Lentinula edodes]|uniref:Dolichyl-phosphate beta-D-mannosyltransferase n=1 Tax=Lentinula lateritia TaxID=40482 RepID=A0A9W9B095_9AGAR|nr:hypothetical protein C8J55DRAFT_576672 [Lentinula edodes]